MMRTANPALRESTFDGFTPSAGGRSMTVMGTVHATGILLLILVVAGGWSWQEFRAADGSPGSWRGWLGGGLLGALVVSIVTVFKKEWSPITAPIYAALEGVVLGIVSAIYEARFEGIVVQASILTVATLGALLAAYRSGLIRATENFKLGLCAALGALCMFYVVAMVLRFAGIGIPYIHQSGPVGIGFSLLLVALAALNLVLDFDFIEKGAERGAPKHMEWYGAFGLTVTLVWLYLEMLRLLGKARRR
jgi:uncharacterized YccA/Bax inhibitor family protein